MAQLRPWTERLLSILEQRSPVREDWLIAEVGGLVPPGLAWRLRERRRRHSVGEFIPQEPSEDAIRYGRRMVIREALHALRARGRIRMYTTNNVRWVTYGRDRELGDRSAASRKAAATMRERGIVKHYSDEARRNMSVAQKRRWTTLPAEQQARIKQHLQMTPAQRSAASRKGWETRRNRERQ
jgi:hypothetical protein